MLTTHHKIPQPSEFVSISNINGSPIQVFDPAGNLIQIVTPTKVNPDPLAPYAIRLGVINNAANIPAGTEYVSTEGLRVVYQVEDGGAFGSDADEQNSYGYNL